MNESETTASPGRMGAFLRIAAVALTPVPFVICVGYVVSVGVDVPYYDQWAFVPTLDRWVRGTWSAGDLVALHNGHPIVLPRLLMLGLASATGWNTVAEMLASCCLLLLSALVLYRLFIPGGVERWSPDGLWRFLPILLVLFSLRQWENLLLGWQLTVFSCLFCSLFAIDQLERSRGIDAALLLGVAGATGASLSFASGLLVWPIGFLLLWCARTRDGRALLAWGIAALSMAAFVAIRLDAPVLAKSGISEQVLYFLTALGSPLATGRAAISADVPVGEAAVVVSALLGAALCGLTMWGAASLYRSGGLRPALPWLLLALLAVGTCALLAASRANLGAAQALSSRYTTLSGLLVIGCYGLLDHASRVGRPRARDVRNSLAAVVVLAFVSATVSESITGPHRRAFFQGRAATLVDYRNLPDARLVGNLHSGAEIRSALGVLEEHGLSVFRNTAIAPTR